MDNGGGHSGGGLMCSLWGNEQPWRVWNKRSGVGSGVDGLGSQGAVRRRAGGGGEQ